MDYKITAQQISTVYCRRGINRYIRIYIYYIQTYTLHRSTIQQTAGQVVERMVKAGVLCVLLDVVCCPQSASHCSSHRNAASLPEIPELSNTFVPTERFRTWERDAIVVHLDVKRRFLQGGMGGMDPLGPL